MKEIITTQPEIKPECQKLIDLVEERRSKEYPLKLEKKSKRKPKRGVANDRNDLDIQFMKTFGTVHQETKELLLGQALNTCVDLCDENAVARSNGNRPLTWGRQ
jgi:hypothetical protein